MYADHTRPACKVKDIVKAYRKKKKIKHFPEGKKKNTLSWYSVDQIVPVHWSDLYAGSNSMCKLKESCKNYEKTIDKSLP